MRRDSIFFRLFQQSPTLLFELLEQPPANADRYRFDSVAVKETKFEIDGVFLPPEGDPPGPVFFVEAQFQRDETLYERLWSESSRYFYQNRQRFSDWQAVVIYPTRQMEQRDRFPHRGLLASEQVHRVYLKELGDIQTLPLGLALMVLTTLSKRQMPEVARALLARSRQKSATPQANRAIIDMLSTIVVYKFTRLSRQEVDAMMGVRLQETRVYQEAREEGEIAILTLLLTQKFGALPDHLTHRLHTLTREKLEALAIALVNLAAIADLETWLAANG